MLADEDNDVTAAFTGCAVAVALWLAVMAACGLLGLIGVYVFGNAC